MVTEPTICGVCRRRATGLGYAPRQGQQVMWLCEDSACHGSAKEFYKMPKAKLEELEKRALRFGGRLGGEYLDSLEVTDLAKLEPETYDEYLRLVLHGYSEFMQSEFTPEEVPY